MTVYQAAMVRINEGIIHLVYTSLQSYVNSLSQGLHYEYAGRGVIVQVSVYWCD